MIQDRENFVKEKLVEMQSDLFYIKDGVSGCGLLMAPL